MCQPVIALGGGKGSPSLKPPDEEACIVADESIEGWCRLDDERMMGRLSTGDIFAEVRMGGSGWCWLGTDGGCDGRLYWLGTWDSRYDGSRMTEPDSLLVFATDGGPCSSHRLIRFSNSLTCIRRASTSLTRLEMAPTRSASTRRSSGSWRVGSMVGLARCSDRTSCKTAMALPTA